MQGNNIACVGFRYRRHEGYRTVQVKRIRVRVNDKRVQGTQLSVADMLKLLTKELQKIDANSPSAAKNAISISDNNGGRILL